MSEWHVSKREQDFTGTPLVPGQLVKPTGAVNDHRLFGANTRWVYRFGGKFAEAIECGTDGCRERFISDAACAHHRRIVHAPERDAREMARIAAVEDAKRREENGETVGGIPVDRVKKGPGGDVPYLKPPF